MKKADETLPRLIFKDISILKPQQRQNNMIKLNLDKHNKKER